MNEMTWRKVMDWEQLHCQECKYPTLLKFQGKPHDLRWVCLGGKGHSSSSRSSRRSRRSSRRHSSSSAAHVTTTHVLLLVC